MGNRLSKIYTRTGDKGTTGLGDGSRVEKDDLRVEAYGTVDELNSALGMVLADDDLPQPLGQWLQDIQHQLFDLGSELCLPGYVAIQETQIETMEQQLDQLNEQLPALKEFILPGGSQAAANCHLARAICRRAERRVYTLSKTVTINEPGLRYLNRLSDFLFVAARVLARHNGGNEIFWQHERTKKPKA